MPTCQACGEQAPETARFCPACGASLAAVAHGESRRRVTVVFSDLAGSTALGERLDPESLRPVMVRYFREMREAVDRHGGVVEKFIGDAVMAVFGIPARREDDALRAVRAAADMRAAQDRLNADLHGRLGVRLRVRTGVNTGEVVTGDPGSGQAFVSGDAVNVAARLEQAAAPGEILIGPETERLVRDAASVEPVEPLALKGKREPLPAFRLLEVGDAAAVPEAAFVGRGAELAGLRAAFHRSFSGTHCALVTLSGAPGVGKSRLVRELEVALGADARFLRGRCLSYGDGGTFLPLAEIVRTAAGIRREDPAADARGKLDALLDGEPDGVAALVATLIGLDDRAQRAEESSWAVRRLVRRLATRPGLVIVLDDVQWAEAGFRDMIEDVAGLDVPLLLLCIGRPELADVAPGLVARSEAVALPPLSDADSRRLAEQLGGGVEPRITERIAAVTGGNPLFVTELVRALVEEGRMERRSGTLVAVGAIDELPVPPTLEALLAARLERLGDAERAVAEAASVVGEEFRRDEVHELAPESVRPRLDACLASLVRDEVIVEAGAEAFRFAHLLIRDVAYAGMLKGRRAELHERLADWLEVRAADRVRELEELLGHHFEQAYRYRTALAPAGDHELALARRACRHLTAAGQRALARVDRPAAVKLLERAMALLPAGDPDGIEAALALAYTVSEQLDLERALEIARAAEEAAAAAGEPDLALRARLEAHWYLGRGAPADRPPEDRDLAARAVARFEAVQDRRGLARAYRQIGIEHFEALHYEAAAEAFGTALVHAEAVADRRAVQELRPWQVSTELLLGPMPASEAARRGEAYLDEVGQRPYDGLHSRVILAGVYHMLGRSEEARALWREVEVVVAELGLEQEALMFGVMMGTGETWSGDLEAAERLLRRSYAVADEFSRWSIAMGLAELLLDTGREQEADALVQGAEAAPIESDVEVEMSRRLVRARLLARSGRYGEAERTAREAVALGEGVDDLNERARAERALAEVLTLAGRREEGAAAFDAAAALLARKENAAALAQLRELRERLAAGAIAG